MKAALTMDMLATDIADYLVRKGVRTSSPSLTYLIGRYHLGRPTISLGDPLL
jgi:hypothetical protein